MTRLRIGILVATLALVGGLGTVSCSDDTPPAEDVAVDAAVDHPVWPDITSPDTTQPDVTWPDQTAADQWQPLPDAYTGEEFGCQSDADCFGLKCCTTPWGVKLCAVRCE